MSLLKEFKKQLLRTIRKKTVLEIEEQESKIWNWITVIFLLLGLIGGGFLIYQ